MITREFNLYLHAGHSIPLVINVNQYDRGETWVFTLFNSDGTQYIPSSGAIVGIKSDNLGIINAGEVDGLGRVLIDETEQMTAAVGKAVFELLIDDQTHGTANFVVLVEPKPGDNADLSESDYSLFQQAIDGTSATAIAEGVADWMDENLTPTTPVVDASLTVQGAAADAKKTGDEISALKSQIEQIEGGGDGLTADIKQALIGFANAVLQLVNNVAFAGDDPTGQTYISDVSDAKDDLLDALYPPANLVSISAVYTQSGIVKDTDSLDSLKSDLVVTAHYDDSTTSEVSAYTLSGTLVEGTSTITVSYEGETTTFTVVVNSSKIMLANWDLTDSLVDSVNGYEFVIDSSTATYGTVVQNSNGVVFTNAASGMRGSLACSQTFPVGATVEFEIDTTANMAKNNGDKGATYGYGNGLMVKLSDIAVINWQGQYDEFRAYYSSKWRDIYNISDPDYFDGKTVKLVTDSNGAITVYADDVQIGKTANSLLSETFTVTFGYGTTKSQSYANMTIKSVKVYTEG